MEKFIVRSAGTTDLRFVDRIVDEIHKASQNKGAGIAIRSNEYISSKILEGKAVIGITESGRWAGFCYIESWGHNKFVANSGLIVADEFRGHGLAKAIKEKAMHLSFQLFPGAKLFGLTTNLAVMKINSNLGYKPVTFSELTDDDEFWKGCESCSYYDILVRTKRTHCLCTGMIKEAEKNNRPQKVKAEKITIE
jgi:RimJ/RimL family protein N-acetyltransferase